MDIYTIIWGIALCITHFCAYCWGRDENKTDAPSVEAWIAAKNHETDRKYEHMRFMMELDRKSEERRREHEKSDDGSSKGPKA